MSTRRLVVLLFLVVLPWWVVPGRASAQQGTAEVRGRVLDAQGGVLPGVTVVVTNQATGIYREVVSTADGSYFVTGILPGTYQISAEITGFKKSSQRDVILSIGKTMTVDLKLEVGGVEETVTVSGESPIIDLTSQEIGGNITKDEISELPSANRNYIEFVGLLPGVVPISSTTSFGADALNVNGQSAASNNFAVDGGNNNDDYLGQGFGSQARTALESVQEFQVLTNQFEAQFGQATGGIVNAITKQGTNRVGGSLFGYFTDSTITAPDFFVKRGNLTKPDTSKQQWGGTVGGPIIRDRAHYFLSVERITVDEGRTGFYPTRPERNYSIAQHTAVWNTLVRFDNQLSPSQTWAVRWLRDVSPQNPQVIGNVTLDALREEKDYDDTVVGTLSSLLGNTRFNTLRFAWTREYIDRSNPAFFDNGRHQEQLQPTLRFPAFDDQQSAATQLRINNNWALEDTFAWFIPGRRGDHDVKMGVQLAYVNHRFDEQSSANGVFSFRTDRPFNVSDFSTYPERLTIRVPAPDTTGMQSKTMGLFVQDKWKMNGRLSLNLGLRYDLEVLPITGPLQPLFDDVTDFPVDKNNIAPRTGFVYDVSGNGRRVIRGGWGMFYDRTHLTLVDEYNRQGVYSGSFLALFPASQIDAGPSAGVRPTDPLLANGPVLNRTLLNQLVPPGTFARNTGIVWLDTPDRKIPYVHTASLGYEHQIGPVMSMSADYIHTFGRDQFIWNNLNPALRVNTTRTGALVRTDLQNLAQRLGISPFSNDVRVRRNIAATEYDALNVQLDKRFSGFWGARVSYTLSSARGNTSGFTDGNNFQVLDQLNLDLNEGPTDFDRRHNFVLSWRTIVPRTGGLQITGVFRALSGLPFTIHDTNVDGDRNGVGFDPLPAGEYSGTGPGAITVKSEGGRNGAYGPGFAQLDMRIGYRRRIGARTLDLFAEIFNVADRANFLNPSGDHRLATFLAPNELRGGGFPRQLQVGARLGF
ncbi:MAG: TonB-dependent receptor [Vicinamibacterales bacterium]